MAERVTYENLFSEARNNVVSIISSKVNDPISSSAQSREWVYSRIPDVKASNFSGYPFIIVRPSDVDISGEKNSVDGKSKEVIWEIEVEIVASDRGYEDGKGLSYIDSISNSIFKEFLDETNRKELRSNSLYFSLPITNAVIQDVILDELVYRRSILLPFRTKMQISA